MAALPVRTDHVVGARKPTANDCAAGGHGARRPLWHQAPLLAAAPFNSYSLNRLETMMKPLVVPFVTRVGACLCVVAACAAGPAMAEAVSLSGDTTGMPTFQRPVEDLGALSLIGTAAHFTAYAFTATVSGDYRFTTSGAFDTFVVLYGDPFQPAAALANALVANDDLSSAGFDVSGFSVGLMAGRQYTYVVTGFDNDEFGAYTTTIAPPAVTSMPEPASWALVAIGLLATACKRRARPPVAPCGAVA